MRIDDIMVSVTDVVINKILKKAPDIAMDAVVGGVAGFFAKFTRFELTESIKEQATQEGLYHFVRDESIADAILESQHLKPSKPMASYGRPTVFLFCGTPSIDNYSKNLTDNEALLGDKLWEKQYNPYITPTGVANAIKFMPTMKDLQNYTFRGLTDSAIMYEGYCILPENAVQKFKMVPDLVRDDQGNPIKDKRGEFQVRFREANQEELSPDGKTYNAKQDYLDYMKEKGIEHGYLNKDGSVKPKFLTKTIATLDNFRMETDETIANFPKNTVDMAKQYWENLKRIFSPKALLAKSAEETLQDFSFKRKNPYRDVGFSLEVSRLQREQGLAQLDLNDVLTDFTGSKDGEFFEKKFRQIGNDITRRGIHGKGHSNRVALTAMMIAHNEGLLENDNDNRVKEILSAAAMYHDIGRILDNGPHARNSARKISKKDLTYIDGRPFAEEDKKMVMALAEAHEGKPDKIEKMIKKYKIQNPANIELLRKLNTVVRDADALDRVRIDTTFPNYKVNLNPKYLVNDTSKRLINAAYQLEFLTKKVPNITNILRFGKKDLSSSDRIAQESHEFNDRLTVEKTPTLAKTDKDTKEVTTELEKEDTIELI